MKTLRIGTRGSPLALAQTNLVVDQLSIHYPDMKIELFPIKTTGDKVSDRTVTAETLSNIGGKALFAKEIEQALSDRTIDIGVHSLKDMEAPLHASMHIAAVLDREEPWDVLVSRTGCTLNDLPPGSVIGTSAPRRTAQVLHLRPDLVIKPIRGNMGTRLQKLETEGYDGTIMALAGLKRLGLTHIISQQFTLEEMVPGVAQGVIAIECLKENMAVRDLLSSINHTPTYTAVMAERACVVALGGHCKTPIGTYAKDGLLHAVIALQDGSRLYRASLRGEAPEILGYAMAKKLMEMSGEDFKIWKTA